MITLHVIALLIEIFLGAVHGADVTAAVSCKQDNVLVVKVLLNFLPTLFLVAVVEKRENQRQN